MIVLALLVYAGFFQGAKIPWWVFVLAAVFDWKMARNISLRTVRVTNHE